MNNNISEGEGERGRGTGQRKRREKRGGCCYSLCSRKRKASLVKFAIYFFLISGQFS